MNTGLLYPDAVDLLKRLIATPSFSREEEKTASILEQFLQERGIPHSRSLNNVWCTNKYFDPAKPTILLNSHHDTVKPNPQYTKDPFTPLEEDGKLFGLGSNDAGGCLVSLVAAFCYFYDRPDMAYNLVLAATAEEEISRRYARLIQPGSQVLDLMGSWNSHLPDSLAVGGLTVLGLNDEELRRNQRATETLVHDLNTDPHLPFGEARFDAVICTASVEYLIDPLAVMREIRRLLKPGGVLAFAFSNRWFPPKAIRPWTEMHEFERLGLVADLFHVTGNFGQVTTLSRRGLPRPVDDPHQELWLSDPVYMVWGMRQ